MNFHIFPSRDHRLDSIQRLEAGGGGQVHVTDDEGGEEPCGQCVEGSEEGQAAECGLDGGDFLHQPHQDSRQALKREQDVEQAEVGDLLKRIQLPFFRLLERMRLVLENSLDVISCTKDMRACRAD